MMPVMLKEARVLRPNLTYPSLERVSIRMPHKTLTTVPQAHKGSSYRGRVDNTHMVPPTTMTVRALVVSDHMANTLMINLIMRRNLRLSGSMSGKIPNFMKCYLMNGGPLLRGRVEPGRNIRDICYKHKELC